MQDHTISQLTKIVKDSFAQYDKQGTKHWTWEVAAHDLSYQIGSLHKVMLQLSGARWTDGKDEALWKPTFGTSLQIYWPKCFI